MLENVFFLRVNGITHRLCVRISPSYYLQAAERRNHATGDMYLSRVSRFLGNDPPTRFRLTCPWSSLPATRAQRDSSLGDPRPITSTSSNLEQGLLGILGEAASKEAQMSWLCSSTQYH